MKTEAIITSVGITNSIIKASCQLMMTMKISAVIRFKTAQVISSVPQVIRSAIRLASDVTRDIIQPTGVRP